MTARLLLLAGLLAGPAAAQWKTETYALRGGWNAIYLHGDAGHATIDTLFETGPAAEVLEIWRWNPNPGAVQFTEAPEIRTPGTPEWSVWKRDQPEATTLVRLSPNAGYLIRCAGTSGTTHTIPLKQKAVPPRLQWVREGANLLGFQTPATGAPTFSNYFQSLPAAIASGSDVFRYLGGELGPANPARVFSSLTERVDRSTAYWFESEVVSDFHGPLHVETDAAGGLAFGETRSTIRLTLRNRTNAPIEVALDPRPSESAPMGQPPIAGPVALTVRKFDPVSTTFPEEPLDGPAVTVPAKDFVELQIGVNRADFAEAPTGSFFASLLRVRDGAGRMDLDLPVSAVKGSLAGLWMGDIALDGVGSVVPGDHAPHTPSTFRLRALVHIAESGSATLLSQAFVGRLADTGTLGVCTAESLLDPDAKADAIRLSAAHLPLDLVAAGSGLVASSSTVAFAVTVASNAPSNPFLHQYHPDHDNLDARFQPIALPAGVTPQNATMADGVEAPAIRRSLEFRFLDYEPSSGLRPLGWGTTVLGGVYQETLEGVHKHPLELSGSFELRRISDIAVLTTP